MDEFGFSLPLPSNASKKNYPNNNPSKYTVELAERMNLDEKTVLALVEVHYPLSFVGNKTTQKRKQPAYDVDTSAASDVQPPSKQKKRSAEIETDAGVVLVLGESDLQKVAPSSSLVTPENVKPECRDVAMGYEDEIEAADRDWERSLLKKTQKLEVCKAEKKAEIEKCDIRVQELIQKYSGLIREMNVTLGEQKGSVRYWKDNFVSLAHMAYSDANQMNNPSVPKYLYIYCDVVKLRQVGDTFAPLLHIARVPPIRISGDTAVDRFDFPRYHRLARTSFDKIEIMIRDEKGRLVEFDHGTVIVTLHFKRIR
jgi:hypothetical protein